MLRQKPCGVAAILIWIRGFEGLSASGSHWNLVNKPDMAHCRAPLRASDNLETITYCFATSDAAVCWHSCLCVGAHPRQSSAEQAATEMQLHSCSQSTFVGKGCSRVPPIKHVFCPLSGSAARRCRPTCCSTAGDSQEAARTQAPQCCESNCSNPVHIASQTPQLLPVVAAALCMAGKQHPSTNAMASVPQSHAVEPNYLQQRCFATFCL